jgi:hypothetical protein
MSKLKKSQVQNFPNTKLPKPKNIPSLRTSRPQNVPHTKHLSYKATQTLPFQLKKSLIQNVPSLKMSQATKRPKVQKIPRYKTERIPNASDYESIFVS